MRKKMHKTILNSETETQLPSLGFKAERHIRAPHSLVALSEGRVLHKEIAENWRAWTSAISSFKARSLAKLGATHFQ